MILDVLHLRPSRKIQPKDGVRQRKYEARSGKAFIMYDVRSLLPDPSEGWDAAAHSCKDHCLPMRGLSATTLLKTSPTMPRSPLSVVTHPSHHEPTQRWPPWQDEPLAPYDPFRQRD